MKYWGYDPDFDVFDGTIVNDPQECQFCGSNTVGDYIYGGRPVCKVCIEQNHLAEIVTGVR